MSLLTRAAILVLIAFIPFQPGAPNAWAQGGDASQGHASPPANYDDIGRLIQAFAESHDASDGQRALDALKYLSLGPSCIGDGKPCPQVKPPIDFSPITTLWLKFFVVLDATEASLAKNLQVPVTQVLPPGENGKPSAYIGQVSPSEIRDPVARREYEAAIAENEKRRLTSNNYWKIQRTRVNAGGDFWLWAGVYRGNAQSREEIVKEAAALGCSSKRIEKIRAVVDASPGTLPPAEEPTSPER